MSVRSESAASAESLLHREFGRFGRFCTVRIRRFGHFSDNSDASDLRDLAAERTRPLFSPAPRVQSWRCARARGSYSDGKPVTQHIGAPLVNVNLLGGGGAVPGGQLTDADVHKLHCAGLITAEQAREAFRRARPALEAESAAQAEEDQP
jgi:hypothetical protein